MRFIWRKLSLSLVVLFALVPMMGQVTLEVVDTEVDGYPADIWVPVILNSPTDEIGGIQFDLSLDPAWVFLGEIISGATGYSADFTGDFNALDENTTRVVFYNAVNANTIPTGIDTVMWLSFSGSDVLSAVIDMSISNMIVSDGTGNIIESSGTAGGIQIGEVVAFSFTDGEADVLETVTLDLNMDNDGAVGGFQLDVFDTPDNVDLVSVATTARSDGFTVETSEVGGGATRILVYYNGNVEIAPGTGSVLSVDFTIHHDAFEGFVGVNMTNAIATDGIGGEYWIAATDSGTVHVTPGYIEEPHNLEAVSGLDGQIPLMWDAPYGPIPQDFGQDFEEGVLPASWTATTNSAVGWFITQDGSSGFWPIPSHTWYACSNDDAADDDGSVDYLITPAINAGGAQNITLNFESYFDGAYGQSAHIEVSTDGTNFSEVTSLGASAEWVTESVDLSAYGGSPQLYIAFHSNDNGAWASGWAVDDISLNFGVGRIERTVHFDFNELGQWVITADKAEAIELYPNGIPYEWKVDWANPLHPESNNASRELSGFNLERSDGNDQNFNTILTPGTNVTEYVDTDVDNSTDYYYRVRAIYTPGGESGPSNVVMATPLEWIEIAISDGGALSGTTDTLDIYLANETNISFFYFEISDIPNYFLGETILETDRTTGWSLDVVELPSGDMAVTGISLGTPLAAGDGAICKIIVRGFSDEEGTATVDFTTASIVDMANNEMPWTSTSGQFHVTIETQTLFFGHAVGNPGEMVTIPFVVSTTQNVHGIQVFLTDAPNYLTGITIAPTTYIDFSSWTVDFSIVGEELRILFFDNTLSNPIPPGTGQIADIYYSIDPGTPVGTAIEIMPDYDNLVVSDVNNLPMHTEVMESHIQVGAPEALFSIANITTPDPNNMVSFDITLNNIVPVYVFDVSLIEVAMNFNVTSISPFGRFANGTIDGSAGEQADGSLSILGYEFATGIVPGDDAILTVEGQVSGDLDMLLYFEMVSAADVNVQPLFAWKIGYGILGVGVVGIEDENVIPTEFALHQNYPNPFNPTTMITYDLKEQSTVSINIFDLTGRQVRTLVSDVQDAGHRYSVWDATDNAGRDVSAGVYIYQIKAGNFSKTKKMLYLK